MPADWFTADGSNFRKPDSTKLSVFLSKCTLSLPLSLYAASSSCGCNNGNMSTKIMDN